MDRAKSSSDFISLSQLNLTHGGPLKYKGPHVDVIMPLWSEQKSLSTTQHLLYNLIISVIKGAEGHKEERWGAVVPARPSQLHNAPVRGRRHKLDTYRQDVDASKANTHWLY